MRFFATSGICLYMGQDTEWTLGNTEVLSLERPLAFVLSGGSAAGAVQVGMLKALAEAGVEPDLVVATSVGAVNGAMVAGHRSQAAERLADIWLSLDRSDILGNLGVRSIASMLLSRSHVFDQGSLHCLIRNHLPVTNFEQLPIPFGAVATNAHTGRTEVLTSGALDQALLASAAIPGFFAQVTIGDVRYFDGGVTANVPVRQAFELGAKSVIVLDAGQVATEAHSPTSMASTIQYVLGLMVRNQQSAIPASVSNQVVSLPLVTPAGLGTFDFSQTPELIESGYRSTRKFLEGHIDLEKFGGPHAFENEWPNVCASSRLKTLV